VHFGVLKHLTMGTPFVHVAPRNDLSRLVARRCRGADGGARTGLTGVRKRHFNECYADV